MHSRRAGWTTPQFTSGFKSCLQAGRRSRLGLTSIVRPNPTSAQLQGADLTGANLYKASLVNVTVFGANLTGTYLHSAQLQGAYLLGADLTGTYSGILGQPASPLPAGWTFTGMPGTLTLIPPSPSMSLK